MKFTHWVILLSLGEGHSQKARDRIRLSSKIFKSGSQKFSKNASTYSTPLGEVNKEINRFQITCGESVLVSVVILPQWKFNSMTPRVLIREVRVPRRTREEVGVGRVDRLLKDPDFPGRVGLG